jgi:hypothetical protein
VRERQPTSSKRFVARGSEPSERQAERSGKRECGGRQPPPAKRFVTRGSEPSEGRAERSGKREYGGLIPSCDSAVLEVGYKAVTIRESASARRLDRAPADGAAGIALGRAGVWGRRPQLLSNVGFRTNLNRLFDSVEQSTGRAPADDAAGQAPQNNNAMRMLFRLTRTIKPTAAVRPSAAQTGVRGSPATTIQRNTPTR